MCAVSIVIQLSCVAAVRRARILKEGSLTMIPYGMNERLLWTHRVAQFMSQARCNNCKCPFLPVHTCCRHIILHSPWSRSGTATACVDTFLPCLPMLQMLAQFMSQARYGQCSCSSLPAVDTSYCSAYGEGCFLASACVLSCLFKHAVDTPHCSIHVSDQVRQMLMRLLYLKTQPLVVSGKTHIFSWGRIEYVDQ